MSEEPVGAIEQVLGRIDDATIRLDGDPASGWLQDASKEEILEWLTCNLRARVVNALNRTKEAMAVLKGAWTERDETLLQTALHHVSHSVSNGQGTDIRCETTEWLRDLKNRVVSRTGRLRNCDRFNTGNVEKDANDALEAYLASGVCGYRAVAGWMLSPINGPSRPCGPGGCGGGR